MDILGTLLEKAAQRVERSPVKRTLLPFNLPYPVDLNRLYAAGLRGAARLVRQQARAKRRKA